MKTVKFYHKRRQRVKKGWRRKKKPAKRSLLIKTLSNKFLSRGFPLGDRRKYDLCIPKMVFGVETKLFDSKGGTAFLKAKNKILP